MTTNLALVKEEKGISFHSLDDLMRLSDFLAKSKLLPTHLQNKPADVAILLMKGSELGLQPMQAVDSIDVIQGKPSLKPEAQLALIYQRMPGAHIAIKVDEKASAVTVQMGRVNGTPTFETTWTMARARQMQLDQKDNYKKQPLTMLKWRAVGEAARTVFPDITRGLYNSVEADDFEAEAKQSTADEIKDAFKAATQVPAEVENTTPEAPEVIPAPIEVLESANGNYVPAMKGWPKGQALKDLDPAVLKKRLQTAKDHLAKTPQAGPEWNEFVQVGQEFLDALERPRGKVETVLEPEPTFEEFTGQPVIVK